MRKLVYLACPYSHASNVVRHMRFEAVNAVAADMLQQGEYVFSPITHGHPLAQVADLPTDWQFWERYCKAFLEASARLAVLMLPGWQESVGVQAEIRIAKELNIPIEFIRIGDENGQLESYDRKA